MLTTPRPTKTASLGENVAARGEVILEALRSYLIISEKNRPIKRRNVNSWHEFPRRLIMVRKLCCQVFCKSVNGDSHRRSRTRLLYTKHAATHLGLGQLYEGLSPPSGRGVSKPRTSYFFTFRPMGLPGDPLRDPTYTFSSRRRKSC